MKPVANVLACLTVLVACGCSRKDEASPYAAELADRDAFSRASLREADAGRALGVSSTPEIQFEEGFGILSFETDRKDGHESFRNHAFRWMGQNAHARLKSDGSGPMKLLVVGWMHHKVVGTSPVMNVFIDGAYMGSSGSIGKDGHYWIELTVPRWALRRTWVDLVIRTTAVGFHWSEPPELKVLNVYRFGWTKAD